MRIVPSVILLAVASAAPMLAIIAVPPTLEYDYILHLPTISSGGELDSSFTDYEFSWKGPLRFGSPDGSACPGPCGPVVPGSTVKTGESFAGFSFTSAGTSPEVNVMFSDFSGASFAASNTVTFTFIEPNSFWTTPGSQTFAGNPSAPPSGTGASFAIGGSDPPCTSCMVITSVGTPEPASWILFGSAMLGVGGMVRRRRQVKE